MDKNFYWKTFEKAEVSRLLSEIEDIEQAEGKTESFGRGYHRGF